MPSKAIRLLTYIAVVAAVMLGSAAFADVTGRPHDLSLSNPKGHCINCHDLHQTKLGAGYAHNLKRANEMEVCYQCHAGTHSNYSSIDPTMPNRTSLISRYDIRSEFEDDHVHFPRYGMDGEHNKCSQCHNPHGVFNHTSTTRKPKLLSAGPDAVTDTDEYCFVCHNNDANPPHQPFSNISLGSPYKFSRTTYKGMTHSTFYRATTVTEPVPDTALTYDDNPYGKGKDISCLTCHRPHGSPNDHMLKSKDDQNFCLACHNGSKAASLTSFTTSGHGKAGVRRVCQECHFPHGTGQENATKKTITDPHTSTDKNAFVNLSGMNAVCFACHGQASSGKYYYGKTAYKAAAHTGAHNPADVSGDQAAGECDNCHNPHGKGFTKMTVDQKESLCYDCHNATTPNTQSGQDVSAMFQMNSHHDLSKVKCVNCHNVHRNTKTQVMMDPFKPQSTVTDKKTFCLKCHSGTTPTGMTGALNVYSTWNNNGHDRTHNLLCSDCHESHGSPNSKNLNYHTVSYSNYSAKFRVGASFGTRAFCELCHNRTGLGYRSAKKIPTGSSYVSQHDQADPTVCNTCHTGRHNPALGSGYYTNACLDCHKQGVGNPLPNANAEFNTPATSGDMNTYSSIHDVTYSPPATVDCVKCHGANHKTDHRPTNKIIDPDPAYGYTNMSSIRRNNIFCLECHGQTKVTLKGITPSNISTVWRNGGHDVTHQMYCTDCHEYHASLNKALIRYKTVAYNNYSAKFRPGMAPTSRAVCEQCHNRTGLGFKGAKMIPTGLGYVGQHDLSDTTLCVNCHTDRHNPRLKDYTGTKAYYTIKCLDCHTSGVKNPYPNSDVEFNTPRTGASDNTKKSIHNVTYNPPSKVDCTKCHGSNHEVDHSLTNKIKDPDPANGLTNMSSIRTNNTFCIECHDSTPIALGNKTGINILYTYTTAGHGTAFAAKTLCSTCHTYHGSTNDKLLSTVINGSAVLSNHSGNNSSVCVACHKGIKRSTPQWSGFTVYSGSVHAFGNPTTGNVVTDGKHAPGACVNCHNPHGVKLSGTKTSNMLYAKEEDLCYICHNSVTKNTSSGDDVKARFQMTTRHAISDADQKGADGIAGNSDDAKIECTDCHDPHTVTERQMAFKNLSGPGGKTVLPEVADQSFCIKCHCATPPTGIKYPAVGVWDKSQFLQSAHGNHLKRDRSFGNYSNGATYACKVCHNPHGSNQAAMQRDTWDIDRDGIPDDIDGDGVLDSTNKVGFIGYSTGTRKVKLVTKMAGIPSRALFKRVSSTIPFQSNGTVDVELCLNCHDGSPAPDVEVFFKKRSHHAVTYADQQADGGVKIECYNCHDQHRAQFRNTTAHYNTTEYATTDPYSPREPMPGDASFCLRCHDNDPPAGISFGNKTGTHRLKNIKLSYNPNNHTYGPYAYDVITTFIGHYSQSDGKALMCRDCHNQHGSDYTKMLRDNTVPGGPNYDAKLNIQNMQAVTLRQSDPVGGGDTLPVTSTTEHCLACHSGVTTYKGNLIPIPPPPDSAARNFTMSSVGKHPDLKDGVAETNGHIYDATFAVITTPGSVKEVCTVCHDSHNPYIKTTNGELMDCYQCHNMNTSLPDVQSEFNDNPTRPTYSKSIHPIKYDPTGNTPAYVECLKCHDQTKHMQGKVRLRKVPTAFDNYTADTEVWVEPVTNRTVNQFCLECHDTVAPVASSFWRGGTEHVPPKLPANHGDGAHFANAGLLCTDCHEYHGSRNNGLRKNASGDEESFCYTCHNNPAKSKSGVNIQSKFSGTASHHQVSSTEQATAGSKVECEDCHNPHSVTRTNSVVSAADKATPVPANDSFCIGCHDANGAKDVKFPGFATSTSGQEWNATTGKWNKWNKSAFTSSGHQTGGVACKSCHDSHGSSNYALLLQSYTSALGKGTGVSVTFGKHSSCRGKRKEEVGVNKVCSSCHKGAMGVYGGYASFTSLSFGTKGMINQTSLSAVRKKGVDKNCTYCHNPHGTTQPNLIRSNKPLYMNFSSSQFGNAYAFKSNRGFANSTTGAPYYMFCSSRSCHDTVSQRDMSTTYSTFKRSDTDNFNMERPAEVFNFNLGGRSGNIFTGSDAKSSHHPMKEGVITCLSCHNEHGSSWTPDLRAPFYRENRWPRLFKSGIGGYENTPPTFSSPNYHYSYGAGFMGTDYFESSGYSSSPNTVNRQKVNTVVPPSNANDLCLMCHAKDDIIGSASTGMTQASTRYLGHEAVQGGAVCTKQISPSGTGLNTDYHNFSCSMCHNPHATGKSKLLKVGCFAAVDNENLNNTWGYTVSIFKCHTYSSPTTTTTPTNLTAFRGWRNLTTSGRKDFTRPTNVVTNLSVTGSDQALLTVSLQWTAVAETPGGAKADHYNVYRYTQAITQLTKPYATRVSRGGTGTGATIGTAMNLTDDTCQPGNTYWYAVTACDAENNESFISNTVQAPSLGTDTLSPNVVTTQTLGQITSGSKNVTITWKDPGDNVNVVKYNIYRRQQSTPLTDGDRSPTYLISGAGVTDLSTSANGNGFPTDGNIYTYVDSTMSYGLDYAYSVVAVDSANNMAGVATGVNLTISVLDPKPAFVSMSSIKPVTRSMSATVQWKQPANDGAFAGYNVYRKASSTLTQSDINPPTGSGFRVMSSVSGLTATDNAVPVTNTTYYYTVTAIDQSSGKQSDIGTIKTLILPSTPTGVTARKLSNSAVALSWTAPSPAVSNFLYYNVYSRRNSGAWTAAATTDYTPSNVAITNGDFETQSSGWTSSGANNTITWDNTSKYAGTYSLKMVSTTTGDNYAVGSTDIVVYPSTSYTYSGYTYVPTALGSGLMTKLRVIEYNAGGSVVADRTEPVGVNQCSSWQKVTQTFTTTSTTTKIRLRLNIAAIGTAYWDSLSLVCNTKQVSTSGWVNMLGYEPGNYEFAVTAYTSLYGFVAPYETYYSPPSAVMGVTDTSVPSTISSVTASLLSPSYIYARAVWSAPSDLNFSGYTPDGINYYLVESSTDQGGTWKLQTRSNLTDPGFDTFAGTADDATVDTFTYWTASNTNAYAVTDSPCDSTAVKIKYTGSGVRSITSIDSHTVATLANKAYSLSFWAKASATSTFQFFIQENGGNSDIIGQTSPSIGTAWQHFSTSGTFPSDAFATAPMVVIRPSSDTAVDITIDAVRLESGSGATVADDGTCFGYGATGGTQTFNDWNTLATGLSVKYRVKSVDASQNYSALATSNLVYTKPTPINDLRAAPSATKTANVVSFTTPATLAGVNHYDVYARYNTGFTNVTSAILVGTFSPSASSRNNGANVALEGTATASSSVGTNPSYVKDASNATGWVGVTGSSAETVTLTFSTAVTLNKVSFVFPSGNITPKDYLVQTYNGSTWVTQKTVTGNAAQNVSYSLDTPVTTTQARISISATVGGMTTNAPTVYEFMVYPGESFEHDMTNASLIAEPGKKYYYAVLATDANGLVSDISSGATTNSIVPDKTGPDKVGNMAVTSKVGSTIANLSWSKPLDNSGKGVGTGATAFEVYRLPTSSIGTPAAVTDDNFATASLVKSRSYSYVNYTSGFVNCTSVWYDHKTVYYAVRSRDAAGNWSVMSNSPHVVVGKDVKAPSPPDITSCVPSTSPKMDVYWLPAVDDTSINGYRLYRADVTDPRFSHYSCITENNIDFATVAQDLIPYDSTSVADMGGTAAKTYFYAMTAWDDENNMSNISNCVTATVRTSSADNVAPTWSGSPLSAVQGGYPDIDLNWTQASDKDNANNNGTIDHYDVYRNYSGSIVSTTNPSTVEKVVTLSGIRNSYIDRTGGHNKLYYYRVVAVDASAAHNSSVLSNEVSAKVAPSPQTDGVAPTVPGSLAASTGVYPNINLSWTASTDVDDVGNPKDLLCYRLYRSVYPFDITKDNYKTDTAHVSMTTIAHDAVSYVDRGISDTRYNYRIEAVDLAGIASTDPPGRDLSNPPATAKVAAAACTDNTPPYAPTNLAAVVGPSPDMALSWTACTDNQGVSCYGVIDHYLLYKDTDVITSGTDLRTLTPIFISGNSTSYTDSSGVANTTYYYVLTSVDSAGNQSVKSNIISKGTAADDMAPAAITDLKATALSQGAHLTWCKPSDNVGVDHYEIYRKPQSAILTDADTVGATNRIRIYTNLGVCLSVDDTGLTGSTAYSYAVIAVDGANNRSTISRGEATGDTYTTTLP